MNPSNSRYVALDIHQNYFMVAAVNAEQETMVTPRRVSLKSLESWAEKHLLAADEVVIEATTNAWFVYDVLQPLVAEVVVAHPYQVKLIASSFVKTDKRDTVALARLLAAHIVPGIWVPPKHVRELRALIAHRQRLMRQRTAAKNRLRAVLHRNRLVAPDGDLFNQGNRDGWASLDVPPSERLRIDHNLDTVDHLSKQMAEAERELALLSHSDR
jgi:transposase